MNNNTPKMTSRIDAPNLQPGLYHPVNQLDPHNPQIYRPISPISQQTIQFPQNFGSIPSNSTPSNANRPKKKIFELVDPSAQNMSINKSPMRTHSPMNSGQMSNPPFINQREFHPEPQQNIHNPHIQHANQPNFNNTQQVPYNRNIQNEQMQMFSNPQEYTFSNQQIHHYPSQSHQYYKPPVNEVLNQKPKWQSSHPSMSGDPYAHNNSSIVHLNNSSISSDKHYPYPHVNNNFPSTNTGSTIENDPLVVDFDATSVYSTTSTSRRTKPIVIMNINIGNGASEEIRVFEGDDPNEVAGNFCVKYNLPPALHSVLVKNLGVQMDKYYALKAEKMQQKLNNLSMLSHSHYPSEPVQQNPQNIISQSHQHIRSEPNHQNNNKTPPAVSPKAQSVKHVEPKNSTKPNQQSHSMNSIHSEGIDDGRSDTKSETKSSKQGTFDRLYQQGMKNIQQKEAVRKELKQRELDQELKNSTFRPTINKHSKEAAARRQAKVEEELAKDGERQTERKEKAKLLKEKLELEGCVFDPEVNVKNLHTGSKTTRSKSPVHNKLYEEGVSKKKEKQKSIDDKKETYSFKPFINPESIAIVEKNRAATIKEDPVQRLYQGSIAPKKSVHKPLEDLVNTDPKTGQKFFQPQINKDNEYYQKASTRQDSYFVEERIEVDEDLFKEVKNSRSSRSLKSIDAAASKAAEERSRSKSSKSIREQDQPVRETFRGVSFGQKNDNISDNNDNPLLFSELDTNKKKHVTGDFGSSAAHTSNKGRTGNDVTMTDREMLMKIFQTLDSNRDGQITEQDVDVSGLDTEVLEVISDVIFSLEDGVIMALDDFTKAIVANNMLNKLRDIHGLPTYEVAPNFITFQSQEVDIKSVQGHNAQQQDDLDNILFGNRDTNTSKSSAFSMTDNTPTSTKGLTKRYQELTEKNFSGKK